MRIILYNIKRILYGKLNLILFILPIVAISIFLIIFNVSMNNTSDKKVFTDCRVGIVDLDNTEYTKDLIKYLENRYSVSILNEDDVNHNLVKNKINYSITFYKGMTDELITGKAVKLEGKSLNNSNLFKFFNEDLSYKLKEARAIGHLSMDSSKFYENIEKVNDANITVKNNKVVRENQINKVNTVLLTFFGFLIFFLIYFNCNMGERLLEDKLSNKLKRVSTTGWSYGKYIGATLIGQILLGLVQITVVFTLLKVVGNNQIKSVLDGSMFSILLLANLVGLSLGVLIATFSKSKNMFLAILNIAINVLAMLGGLYWPLEVMPKFVINISKFIPTYWLRTALNMSLEGNDIKNYGMKLLIVVVFVIGFIVVASIKEKKWTMSLKEKKVARSS